MDKNQIPSISDSTPEELEKAIEERGKNICWLTYTFLLTCAPGVLNSAQLTSYTFLSSPPKFWCKISELNNANWSSDSIKNISAINPQEDGNCQMYDWNYTFFKTVGIEEAKKYIESNPKPDQIKCTEYEYEEEKPTIISEWDLVCSRNAMKSLAQVSVALGKFFGAIIVGTLADKFGRKKCFVSCGLLYMFVCPLAGYTKYFYVFLLMRLLIGVAGSGCYETGFTLLTESTLSGIRARLGCFYNTSYSVGLMFLAVCAYFAQSWRQLQYYLSIPVVLLIVNCFVLRESPRWLYSQGRVQEAYDVLRGKKRNFNVFSKSFWKKTPDQQPEGDTTPSKGWFKQIFYASDRLTQIYTHPELLKRIIIIATTWYSAQLYYFLIALNADNFTADKYIYVALNGVAEMVGYFLSMIVVTIMTRKVAGYSLLNASGIALLIILLIPDNTIIMWIALGGRCCVSTVYAVIIVYTGELFPTSNRNSAFGISLTMAQLGSVCAGLIVDFLGAIKWYLPSTFCGALVIFQAHLLILLPETKDKQILDKIEEIDDLKDSEKVSFRYMCKWN